MDLLRPGERGDGKEVTYRHQTGVTSSDVCSLATKAVLICFTYTVGLGKGQTSS